MNGNQQNPKSDQIDSTTGQGRLADPSGTYSRIQQDLAFLLDSDDDEDMDRAQEDGMIEKDLDNWIWAEAIWEILRLTLVEVKLKISYI